MSHSHRLRRALSLSSSLLHHQPKFLSRPIISSTSLSSTLNNTQNPSFPSVSELQIRSFRSSTISLSYRSSGPSDDQEIGPDTILFEGCDYNHWLITMDLPKDLTPELKVDAYVKAAAQVFGSEEEAKKKIYACSTTVYVGFQVECSEETSEKFKEVEGVVFVLPDSYIDPINKEYGGDKYINGTIIPRPPPIQYGRREGRYGDRRTRDQPNTNRGPMHGDNRNFGPPQNPPYQRNYGPPGGHPPQQNYGVPPSQQNYGFRQNPPPGQNYGQPHNPPPGQNYGLPQNPLPGQNYGLPQNPPPGQNYGPPQNPPPVHNYGQTQNVPPQQNYGHQPSFTAPQNYGPQGTNFPAQQNYGPQGTNFPAQQNYGPTGGIERNGPTNAPGGWNNQQDGRRDFQQGDQRGYMSPDQRSFAGKDQSYKSPQNASLNQGLGGPQQGMNPGHGQSYSANAEDQRFSQGGYGSSPQGGEQRHHTATELADKRY